MKLASLRVTQVLLAVAATGCRAEEPGAASIVPGAAFTVSGKSAKLTRLDTLPLVESDYSRLFKFDAADNPKLTELREHYRLEEVVAPGKDEFQKQLLLLDWTHRQFKKFGRPSSGAKGALEVLRDIEAGHSFFCSQYAQVLVSAAASLGWVNRPLALRRHQGVNKNGGSTEHTATEMWSNQHSKWVMLDPTSNLHLEKNGVPLNAWEIREEWFHHEGKDLTFLIGKEQQPYRKANLPVKLGRFEGFGDLTLDPDELDKYGFIAFVPNTDLLDSGFDYGRMFIIKDALCDGTQWHTRKVPAHPATDPYFPIGQAALQLTLTDGKLTATLKTLTPNFREFEVRTAGGAWSKSGAVFHWTMHAGSNRLEARTVNAFGVKGPVSSAEVTVE